MSIVVKAPAKKAKTVWWKHEWTTETGKAGVYFLVIDGLFAATIQSGGSGWLMTVTVDGVHYSGQRATLEEAAKAVDRLLYKNLPHEWTLTNANAIMPWKGDLTFEA
jgi:hypothetical protein